MLRSSAVLVLLVVLPFVILQGAQVLEIIEGPGNFNQIPEHNKYLTVYGGLPKCPDDQTVQCLVDPCDPRFASCPGDPHAVCHSNYCQQDIVFLGTLLPGGGCNDVWVNYSENRVVSDEECSGGD